MDSWSNLFCTGYYGYRNHILDVSRSIRWLISYLGSHYWYCVISDVKPTIGASVMVHIKVFGLWSRSAKASITAYWYESIKYTTDIVSIPMLNPPSAYHQWFISRYSFCDLRLPNLPLRTAYSYESIKYIRQLVFNLYSPTFLFVMKIILIQKIVIVYNISKQILIFDRLREALLLNLTTKTRCSELVATHDVTFSYISC